MTIITDGFTGSGTLGANWTGSTVSSYSRSSDHCVTSGATNSVVRWASNTFSGDQYAKITIAALASSGNFLSGPLIKSSGDGTGYRMSIKPDRMIVQNLNAATNTIDNTTVTVANGDIIELRMVGNVLSMYQNGTSRGTSTEGSPLTGTYVGFGTYSTDASGLIDNFEGGDYAATDTTAPVLTSPTGTATGSTTASGTISTDTAEGTLYFLASINATETAATVKAASSQSVTTTGSQSVSFTGLTASTAYYAHYCHRDVAGNDSTVSNSASFTTSAPSDTTAPTMAGSITASAITTTGFTISWPAASDNVAVTGYEYSTNGGSTYTDAGNVLTKAVTGLSPGTAYSVKVRAYDAAANKSTPALSASVTTAVGTITSPALKNNTGTLLASETGVVVNVYNSTTGALVVRKTGLTSDTSGIVAIADAALVPGTSYAYEVVLAANGRRLPVETAT